MLKLQTCTKQWLNYSSSQLHQMSENTSNFSHILLETSLPVRGKHKQPCLAKLNLRELTLLLRASHPWKSWRDVLAVKPCTSHPWKSWRDVLTIKPCSTVLLCAANDCSSNITSEIWETRADTFCGIDKRDPSAVVVMVSNAETLEDMRLPTKRERERGVNFGINIFKCS